jgi:predicted porin
VDTSYSDTTFGVSVPMGAITLFASTGTGSLKADTAVANVQSKGKQVSYKAHQIGASYAMSKRTNVYAIMGEDEGKRKANALTAANATTAATGTKVTNSSMHVGVRHSF